MLANTAAPPNRAPMATPAVGRAPALVPVPVAAVERELASLPAALVRELSAELRPPALVPVADDN